MAILRYRGVEDADRFDSVEMFTKDPNSMHGVRMVRVRYDKRLRVRSRRREMDQRPVETTVITSLRKYAWAAVCALGVVEAFWFWEVKNLVAGISACVLVTLVLSAAWLTHENDKSAQDGPRKYY